MKKAKEEFYNCIPDEKILGAIFIILFFITCVVAMDITIFKIVIIIILWGGYGLLCRIYKRKKRVDKNKYTYLTCRCSMFVPKHIWINQDINPNKAIERCPQEEFLRELNQIRKNIKKGYTYYFRTHEKIANKVKDYFPNAIITKTEKKDLKEIKVKLKAPICEKCKSTKCTLNKEEKAQFYRVKIVGEENMCK